MRLPALVLKEPALANNISVMAGYAREHGFLLAPHGKTTMAPKLFKRQLAAGAWGITVANMAQAFVAYGAGATRVLVANELVSQADAVAVAEVLAVPERELYCLVDSVEGVGLLDFHLERAGMTNRRLDVLVELGAAGRRTGARSETAALAVADEVAQTGHLALAGVEGYEGVLAGDRSPQSLAKVDAFLLALRKLVVLFADNGAFAGRARALVSAGGSKYFDRVASILGAPAHLQGHYGAHKVQLVVRSGCYLVHDHGDSASASPLAGTRSGSLQAALELWAEVLSVPEPGLAIVGMGKRDAPYDLGLPVPLGVLRGREVEPVPGASLRELNDQHGYLFVGQPGNEVVVGDRVVFGISHPCTAFDKWRTVLLVDAAYEVLDEIHTFFH
jgi:D-serine deaminase-like pyridoxal phosphate-dependent protein